MSEDIVLMEMPDAFERGQHGPSPDLVRVGNAQYNNRQLRSMPLGVVLTGYRLLATIVILGIGIPKAVYSYYGQSLISSSLDWVGGIILALLLFWLGVIEATRPELCPRFFEVDLAPTILGFLGRNDTPSPLDPASIGSLHRDNTLHLTPPTLESPRRGPHPSPFPAYISHHPDRPPPILSSPVPSILASNHPATTAHSMSPTVQLAGTTTNHQNIDPSMLDLMRRVSRPFARSWTSLDVNERERGVDLSDLRDEELESRPEEAGYASGRSHSPITWAHSAPNNQGAFPVWQLDDVRYNADAVEDGLLHVTIAFRKIRRVTPA